MKKRMLSLLLLAALIFAVLPVPARAAMPKIPIYVGNLEADYMAEEILKGIPTAGLSDREQIQAVYDWIIENFARSGDTTRNYFDPNEIYAAAHGQFAQDVTRMAENGQIVFRADLKSKSGAPLSSYDTIDYDANYYVGAYAYEMMLHRVGNCAHFSTLLTVLLGHLGFDCRMFHGEFINLDGSAVEHAWTYILVDGTYLWADIRIDHSVRQQTGAPSYTYFLVEDTEAWAREHNWDHTYSDWLQEHEAEIAAELQLAAEAGLGPWGMCSDWAKDYMQQAGAAGLIPASLDYQDLTLGITRGEFAAVSVQLYEALQAPVAPYQGESPFTDTSDPDILRAYSLGVVNGMGDGTFAPDAGLTREQAVTMLGRVYELALTNSISDGSTLVQGSIRFTDQDQIFDYARNYVSFFVSQNILAGMGDGTFAPKVPMTREQALKVAAETVNKLS